MKVDYDLAVMFFVALLLAWAISPWVAVSFLMEWTYCKRWEIGRTCGPKRLWRPLCYAGLINRR